MSNRVAVVSDCTLVLCDLGRSVVPGTRLCLQCMTATVVAVYKKICFLKTLVAVYDCTVVSCDTGRSVVQVQVVSVCIV